MKKPPAPPAPALRVEYLRLRDIPPAILNPKRHAGKALEASILRFGFAEPMVLDGRTGRLVAGHGRREALLALEGRGGPAPAQIEARADGWYAPVLVGWSSANDEEAGAYLLAANKLTEAGGWDPGELGAAIERVRASVDLTQFGFNQHELARAIQAARDVALAVAPVTDSEDGLDGLPSVTKSGDLWQLGQHRVLCGDSTKPEHVARLMGGAKASLVFTSPPYKDQREYTEASAETAGDWGALMRGVFSVLPVSDDAQVLVNLGLTHDEGRVVRYWDEWLDWQSEQPGWSFFAWYVWDKMSPTFRGNDGRLWMAHEWVFHFNRARKECVEWVPCTHAGIERGPNGERSPNGTVRKLSTPGLIKSHRPPGSVIHVQRETRNHGPDHVHPARFPVALPEFVMRTWPGITYDPFMGSGSTLIAAERSGLQSFGMEIDPGYCDVIVERFKRATGKVPELVR